MKMKKKQNFQVKYLQNQRNEIYLYISKMFAVKSAFQSNYG